MDVWHVTKGKEGAVVLCFLSLSLSLCGFFFSLESMGSMAVSYLQCMYGDADADADGSGRLANVVPR